MIKFKILTVGKIKEQYFKDAIAEYKKRLSRFAETEIAEVEECLFSGIPNQAEKQKIMSVEGSRLLEKVEGCLVVLDIDGKQLSSVELSEKIQKLSLTHSTFTFVIGGSYGLSKEVKERAEFRLSFGKITLPHQLCRVVLAEQLYRAMTIKNNVPYHK